MSRAATHASAKAEMDRAIAFTRVDLRLDCGVVEVLEDVVHLFPPAQLARRPDAVALNRGRSSRGQADRKNLG
jgi:hypothetical protein